MRFTANMLLLLTSILYWAPGPAAIRTVCKYITDVIFCSRTILFGRCRSFTSRKLYVGVETF